MPSEYPCCCLTAACQVAISAAACQLYDAYSSFCLPACVVLFCHSYSRFKLKKRVVVNYKGLNKWWCPGVIIKIDDTPDVALYDIKFDDGDQLNGIPELLLLWEKERFPTAVIKTNSKVVAKRKDGYWYPGTVTKARTGAETFSATTSCDILYDCGHQRKELSVELIRLECNADRESAVFMIGSAVQVVSSSGDLRAATVLEKSTMQPLNMCAVRFDEDTSGLRKLVPWTQIKQSTAFFSKQSTRNEYR